MGQFFDSFFPLHSRRPGRQGFNVSHFLRFMSPRVSGAFPAKVQFNTLVNILGVSSVEGSILAKENVDVEGQL